MYGSTIFVNSYGVGVASYIIVLFVNGEPDVLVAYEHTRRMNIKLTAEGVRHMVLNLPWATHGFDYAFNGPGSQLSIYTVERFLAAVTN
jgi:acetyl esterase/lipase